MYDRETESVWFQVGGRAVKGEMTDTVLKTGPMLDTTWARWKKLHPDTLVMSNDNEFKKNYTAKGRKPYRGVSDSMGFPAPYFQQTLTKEDKRLKKYEMVLAIAIKPESNEKEKNEKDKNRKERPIEPLYRAYPISALKDSPGLLNDDWGKTSLVAFYDAETSTGTAFLRKLDDQTLTFEAKKNAEDKVEFFDKETGSKWNIEGLAEDGKLKGKQLTALDYHLSEWYGWVSYFPETTIYGRNDPSQTTELRLNGFGDEN